MDETDRGNRTAGSHSTPTLRERIVPTGRRALGLLAEPPLWLEIVLWLVVIVSVVWIRAYLMRLVPVYLWSKDADSYSRMAWVWLDTGHWEIHPRRGPVYSLIITACLKLWGSFNSVIVLQHVLGGLSVLMAIGVLRVMFGRRAMIPLAACGYAYAVYAGALEMEHTIRNETLLFVFSTVALTAWYLAIRFRSASALGVSGFAAGLLALTKNVLAPLPLAILGGIVWLRRATPLSAAKHAIVFIVAFALPIVGAKIFKQLTVHSEPRPQTGLLLFARVAQFTVLDGGIQPENKAIIRADIEEYRAFIKKEGKLDNNLILNRTAVPKLQQRYKEIGRTPSDLSRDCRALAIEAIGAHPGEYAVQVWGDLVQLELESGGNMKGPDANDLIASRKVLESLDEDRAGLHLPEALRNLDERTEKRYFKEYQRAVRGAWLFNLAPGLLTSIAVTALAFFTRGERRVWWITLAVVWWFTVALLCTVGRPIDRYVLPVIPVVFWSLTTVLILGWNWLMGKAMQEA